MLLNTYVWRINAYAWYWCCADIAISPTIRSAVSACDEDVKSRTRRICYQHVILCNILCSLYSWSLRPFHCLVDAFIFSQQWSSNNCYELVDVPGLPFVCLLYVSDSEIFPRCCCLLFGSLWHFHRESIVKGDMQRFFAELMKSSF